MTERSGHRKSAHAPEILERLVDRGHVPELGRDVEAAGDDPAAVGTERPRAHFLVERTLPVVGARSTIRKVRSQLLARAGQQEISFDIPRRNEQLLSIGTPSRGQEPGDAVHRLVLVDQLASLEIPESQKAVPAGRNQNGLMRRELQALNRRSMVAQDALIAQL